MFLLLFLLSVCGVTLVNSTDALPSITSTNGVLNTLLIAEVDTINLAGEEASLMLWNGSYIPPTFRLKPGDEFSLTVSNRLDQNTNVHFHGLTVSPKDSADNSFLEIPGRQSHTYSFKLSSNHTPGLFFYHSHTHGTTEQQVFQGLSGLFIVEGLLDPFPSRDTIREVAIVLKDIQIEDSTVPKFINLSKPTIRTVNGLVNPTIDVTPNEIQFWRVANAGANIFYNIFFSSSSKEEEEAMEELTIWKIASDGSGLYNEPIVWSSNTSFLLGPGNRVEFLLSIPAAGIYSFQSSEIQLGEHGPHYPQATLATLNSSGSPLPLSSPFTGVMFPNIVDLRTVVVNSTRELSFGMKHSMDQPQIFFESSIFLITFILLGRYLENRAKAKTSQALAKLFDLKATNACLITIDKSGHVTSEEEIDTNLIEVGDLLKVRPGEKIPCDGKVIFGNSATDEALITGESMPVKKTIGSDVIGGTINQTGVLHVEAEKVGSDTALSQIINLVEEAQSSKSQTQHLADSISGVFVPIVIALSFLTFVIWIVVTTTGALPAYKIINGGNPFVFSLMFAITVVVIACPCALGLAVPTAVMVGTGIAAKLHILIKGGDVLEKAHGISHIMFDKTGTLTIGHPTVTHHVIMNSKLSPSRFWSFVGSAEVNSEHPLGKCIADFAQTQDGYKVQNVEHFKAKTGMGIKCSIGDVAVFIGNRKLMKKHKIDIPEEVNLKMQYYEERGNTVMLVAIKKTLSGVIAVSDPVRPEAKIVCKALKQKGISLSIISGDNFKTVSAISKEVGIDTIFAEVLPRHKKDTVEEQQKAGHIVAMVGDGINDSPALAQADVGIAIGSGTDVAIESADIILMRSNLEDILITIDLAKVTYNRIMINFFWAFAYNLLAVPIAAGVLYPATYQVIPPWVAGVAMAISSISVLASSLLLNLYKPPKLPKPLISVSMDEDM